MAVKERNPFTPTFGFAPHVLIGRNRILDASARSLAAGPGDSGFASLYMGPRGSGKTVLLNEIEDAAARRGWTVISVDAGSQGVSERIEEMIDWANSADSDGVEQVKSVKGFHLGPVSAHRETLHTAKARRGLRRQITDLASSAAERGNGVLLSIDEMHRCDADALLRLANDVQHVSQRHKLPLAFAGASLPQIKHTYLDDDRFSFFRRCEAFDLPPIDAADAFRFITESVTTADGRCTREAARLLADAGGGLPYHLHLLGDHAWRIAGAPDSEIGAEAAVEAVRIAERVVNERVYRPTFNSLTEVERSYLAALAEHGDAAARSELGATSPLSAAQMATAERWLIDNACIEIRNAHESPAEPDTVIGFGCAVTLATVAGHTGVEAGYRPAQAPAPPQPIRAMSPRCNHPMPRARARCILRLGHPGGHRSR